MQHLLAGAALTIPKYFGYKGIQAGLLLLPRPHFCSDTNETLMNRIRQIRSIQDVNRAAEAGIASHLVQLS